MLVLCTFVAAIVSFVAVKWLLRFVQSHTFIAFGWYRIGLAIVMAILFYALHWETKPFRAGHDAGGIQTVAPAFGVRELAPAF